MFDSMDIFRMHRKEKSSLRKYKNFCFTAITKMVFCLKNRFFNEIYFWVSRYIGFKGTQKVCSFKNRFLGGIKGNILVNIVCAGLV